MSFYDPTTQFAGRASNAIVAYLGGWRVNPIVMPILPWWERHTIKIPGAKLEERVPLAIHKPGLKRWEGSFEFDEMSGLFFIVKRQSWTKGTKANVMELGEYDFRGWSLAPQTMAVELGNNPGIQLVGLLNGAYTATDQIFGGTFAVLSGGTKKKVNPAVPSVGTDWYNARENVALNPTNIVAAIKNMQTRQAMNGVEMGIGNEGLEIWVPYTDLETARQYLEVFRELGGVQGTVTYEADYGGSSTTQTLPVIAAQTNPIFGRAKVVPVHGMRSDMWCVVAPPPFPGAELFLYSHGGEYGQYGINNDPMAPTLATVPHILTVVHGESSPMYLNHLQVGIGNLLNEGFALGGSWCIEFNFTGSAS